MSTDNNRFKPETLGGAANEDLGMRAQIIDLAVYRAIVSSLRAHPEIADIEARQEALRQAQAAGSQIVQNTAEVTVQPLPVEPINDEDPFLQRARAQVNEAHRAA